MRLVADTGGDGSGRHRRVSTGVFEVAALEVGYVCCVDAVSFGEWLLEG